MICHQWCRLGRGWSFEEDLPSGNLVGKFGREGAVQIPLSRMLKTIEQRILAEPKHPSGWRMQINLDTAEPPSEVGLTLPSSAAMASFLATREEFFAAVRKDTAELIMQGLSFRDSEKECLAYAEGYLDLVRNLIRQAETTSVLSASSTCKRSEMCWPSIPFMSS
jgi:DNA phosphorothioation-dependent restriction protein DptH